MEHSVKLVTAAKIIYFPLSFRVFVSLVRCSLIFHANNLAVMLKSIDIHSYGLFANCQPLDDDNNVHLIKTLPWFPISA